MRKEDDCEHFTEADARLMGQITSTVRTPDGASNLAAMAHFEQSVMPTVALARDHIIAITTMLKVAQKRQETVPDAVVWNLETVGHALQEIQTQFKAEFFRELRAHAASAGPYSSPNRPEVIQQSGTGAK